MSYLTRIEDCKDDFERSCVRQVQSIAEELENRYNGYDDQIDELKEELEKLEDIEPEKPDQLENETDEEYDNRYEKWKKEHEDWEEKQTELEDKILELEEKGDLQSYFEDFLDIDYIVNYKKEYQSARITVTCGGPNIWVDTEDGAVKLAWGSTRAEAYLTYNCRDAIDEIAAEYYEIA